jgi:hypothetical protein
MDMCFERKEAVINDKTMTFYETGSGKVTCVFSSGW